MPEDGAWKTGTVADVIRWLLDQKNLDELTWPPDLFAVAASVLQKSGAYPVVIESWPPGADVEEREQWVQQISKVGKSWRRNPEQPPTRLKNAVSSVITHQDRELFELREDRALCSALLEICAIADEACVGVDIPETESQDSLANRARKLLTPIDNRETTLCSRVHPSKLRVLPKLHTPQSGMTVRSLTHHLALCESREVDPLWLVYDFPRSKPLDRLNLLILPWPLTIVPAQFTAVPRDESRLPYMPSGTYGGFFEYTPPDQDPDKFVGDVLDALRDATRVVGPIDGIVLPELAMTELQRDALRSKLVEGEGIFLLGGVAGRDPARNYLVLDLPIHGVQTASIEIKQHKHHRWQLDRRQIIQYGLGYRLDPTRKWWEHISICDDTASREVHFAALCNWLTVTPLICEDLAR